MHDIVSLIGNGLYSVVLVCRILGNEAIKGGMPIYMCVFNRILTLTQNIYLGQKMSEYHTGYRAFKCEVLKNISYTKNSNDFVFDKVIIAQILNHDYNIAEVTCPTKYFEEAYSINLAEVLNNMDF